MSFSVVRAIKRRKPPEKESWEDFEKRVGVKRNDGKESRKAVGKVQNDILIQRMSSTESGTLNKCEPLDTRDFVPFEVFEERVRSFTMLPLVRAPSWPPIVDVPAQTHLRKSTKHPKVANLY